MQNSPAIVMDVNLFFPEYSAQGTNSKPNPLVRKTLELLTRTGSFGVKKEPEIVDLGCGKLRHLKIFTKFTNRIVLVDTKIQIERTQKFGGTLSTMKDYINATRNGLNVKILTVEEFEKRNINADIIYSVAVMDAVQQKTRLQITKSAYNNLKFDKYFVVIVPRNDSSILENCKYENQYEDGYFFKNRDKFTFYVNFRDPTPLLRMIENIGFGLIVDSSRYRYICWIFQKCR